MKIANVIVLSLVIIIGLSLGFFSGIYPKISMITSLIYTILYFYGLYLIISKKHKMKPKWASLIGSFLLPGLGQVIYAKQWLKMIILLIIIMIGPIIALIMLSFIPLISFCLMFLAIGVQIYNLINAYGVGKKAEEKI